MLTRVDCQGTQATLHVQNGRSVTKLLVVDPNTVAIAGGGERRFPAARRNQHAKWKWSTSPDTMKKVTRIEFR